MNTSILEDRESIEVAGDECLHEAGTCGGGGQGVESSGATRECVAAQQVTRAPTHVHEAPVATHVHRSPQVAEHAVVLNARAYK
jgi:hypothetical protein